MPLLAPFVAVFFGVGAGLAAAAAPSAALPFLAAGAPAASPSVDRFLPAIQQLVFMNRLFDTVVILHPLTAYDRTRIFNECHMQQ